MSANLIPITSDGGFITAGNITGNVANVYAMNISQSITWPGDSSVYEDTSLVLQGNVSVSITSPNTTQITANTSTWSFDNTGNLSLPEGGSIYSEGFTPSGNPGNTITLQPSGSGTTTNQKLLVYPTAGDGDHIHMTSGNLYETELFLGSDGLFVKLANTGNIVINSNDDNGNIGTWTFGTNDSLTLPKNSIINEVTPVTGAAASIIVQQGSSSIANGLFVSLPPATVTNYTVPGTDIIVTVTWVANGPSYYAPRFTVVNGGTGHTGGGEFGGGEVLTVPYVDMGITGGGNWTWYVGTIASNLILEAGLNSWTFGGNGNLTLPAGGTLIVSGGIVSNGASPAPTLSGFSSVSALTLSASGNITGGNVSATNLSGNGGNITYQQTNTFYVDPGRTQNYTPSGTQIQPFFTITTAITAATNAGYNDTNPAFIVLMENITENVTLKPGIWLTSLGTGTHGSPVITGTVTVTSSTGSTVSNHYSISNLRIVAPTSGHGILFTGTAPQRLYVRDMWIDASGTGDCIYTDNTGSGSTLHLDIAHLTHSGTGDVYCINVTKGNCYITDIETSGAVQVAAVQTGAVMTIDGSELDAVGDVVCETYGTGSLTITNSIINNTQANSYGIKINDAGSTVTVGQCLFNVPAGAGEAVWYNPSAALGGSNFAFVSISFFPGTNSTINARLVPIPLAVAVGTIASPILYGDITSYAVAQDWDLIDNNASALSFDTTGKAGIINIVTTNSAEGVTMSGYANVTGNVTGGNLSTAGYITANGGAYGEVVTTPFASVFGTGSGPNPRSIIQARGADLTAGIGMQAYSGLNGQIYANTGITFTTGATLRDKDYPTGGTTRATIDANGLSVTGIANISGNIIGGNISTAGNISGNTNGFTIGYLNIPQIAAANATLALTDSGKHYYSTSSGNFTLTIPNNSSVTFATGTAISIVVQSAGNVLVNAASGVTLYMAGNSSAANRVVSNYGMATIMKVATDTWMINGTGVA